VLKSTHVIMLSAKGQQQDKDMAKLMGADEYIVKPFSPAELLRQLNIYSNNGDA